MTVNWEFFDNMDVPRGAARSSTRCGRASRSAPTRGAALCTFKEMARSSPGSTTASPTERPPTATMLAGVLTPAPRHGGTTGARRSPADAADGATAATTTDGGLMPMALTPILTAHWDEPDCLTLDRLPAATAATTRCARRCQPTPTS